VVVIGNDMADLHKYVHASILPEEYGGTMPASDCTETVNLFMQTDREWQKDLKYGYVHKSGRCKDEDDEPDLVPASVPEESCAA
ncbi:hypothetical protein AVEN_198014-1, partial [Araneus ventricosus]